MKKQNKGIRSYLETNKITNKRGITEEQFAELEEQASLLNRYITVNVVADLVKENKQLKKEKRELKKENKALNKLLKILTLNKTKQKELEKEVKALKVKSEVQELYIDVTEGYIPPQFYSAVLERYARLNKHLKVVYGAYIILAISTLMMIINFYLQSTGYKK